MQKKSHEPGEPPPADKKRFPGLDVIRSRVPTGGKGKRKRRAYTEEELARMPPSWRRRALFGQTRSIMKRDGLLSNLPTHRSSKLTRELIDDIARMLATGAPLAYVAQAVGVATLTLGEWMHKGASPDFDGTLYAELVTEVSRARGRALVASVASIKSGRKGWQGPAWLLERTDRERWQPPAAPRDEPFRGVAITDERGNLTAEGGALCARVGEAVARALASSGVSLEIGERVMSAFASELDAALVALPAATSPASMDDDPSVDAGEDADEEDQTP